MADRNEPPAVTDDAEQPPLDQAGADLIGTVLAGRYRILKMLGRGAMGTVYLGEHIRMGRRTALKVLNAADHDPGSVARFTRGAQNAANIDHPNVCRVFDLGDPPGGLHFLAMEYIEGDSLYDVIAREGTLPPERALSFAIQIADALQAAHDLGIVHRDLKPGNIMITRGPDGAELVKVVDFDIAKSITATPESEVTTLGWLVGTPEYMSPEQFLGGALDGRSDVYSLGVILFRMLTGRFPFSSTTAREIMWERLHEEPLTLEEATGHPPPRGLQAAIDRALRVPVEERWESASAFREALRAELLEPSEDPAGGSPRVSATPAASPLPPWPKTVQSPARGQSTAPSGSVPRTIAAPRDQSHPLPQAGATPAPEATPPWRRPVLVGVVALTVLGVGFGVTKFLERTPTVSEDGQAGTGGNTPSQGPGGGENTGYPGGGGGPTPEPDTTGRGRAGGPAQDPEDSDSGGLPPVVIPTLTAAAARDSLTALQERLGQLLGQEGGVRASVGSDVAEQALTIFNRFGSERELQANAAYILSVALCEQGRTGEARSWAIRSDELDPSPADSVMLRFLTGPAADCGG